MLVLCKHLFESAPRIDREILDIFVSRLMLRGKGRTSLCFKASIENVIEIWTRIGKCLVDGGVEVKFGSIELRRLGLVVLDLLPASLQIFFRVFDGSAHGLEYEMRGGFA